MNGHAEQPMPAFSSLRDEVVFQIKQLIGTCDGRRIEFQKQVEALAKQQAEFQEAIDLLSQEAKALDGILKQATGKYDYETKTANVPERWGR